MRTRSNTVVVVQIPARLAMASLMSEAQFDRLLDAVKAAMEPASHGLAETNGRLKATNDNHLAWPLIPFPEGWYAAHAGCGAERAYKVLPRWGWPHRPA
jgi:hypothetical protein